MAGIIKAAGRSDAALKGAAQAFHFDDVGRSYLERLRGEAHKIVDSARQEAARIKTQAAEEGKQAAIQAAQSALRAQLDQQLTSVLAALGQAVQNLHDARQTWQQHWEQHAVQLAAAIAERLCRRELSRQPEISLTWVREALELAAGNARVAVRLHPSDLSVLGERIQTVSKQLAGLGQVELSADPAISPGGCRVDTEFGSLDQQLESQLARICEELLA